LIAMNRAAIAAVLTSICLVANVHLSVAAGTPEQAGPPASAAPPAAPAAAPYTPPRSAPRSAAADEAMYERCMNLAKSDPDKARELAEHWQKTGGAHPAEHCYAVALIGLKQYRDGASRLDALAQAMVNAPAALRAEVYDQASQAWLLADDAAHAYAAGTQALKLSPDDPDLLIDRAEAAGSEGWYDKAVADLDRVLKADPNRVDALIYRASANRELGKFDLALGDADRAVQLAPNSVSALLERGDILRLKGDLGGARRDWVRVSELAPGTAADAEAKTNIERLELKEDTAAPPEAKQ
jgi:tetratricopeptide (TPR) repeat protein